MTDRVRSDPATPRLSPPTTAPACASACLTASDVAVEKVRWSPVFAGVLVAALSFIVLHVTGAVWRASSVYLLMQSLIDPLICPVTQDDFLGNVERRSGVWPVVSGLCSLSLGAYIAGRYAAAVGWVHGVLVWAVAITCALGVLSVLTPRVAGLAALPGAERLPLTGEGVMLLLAGGREAPRSLGTAHLDPSDSTLKGMQQRLDLLLNRSAYRHSEADTLREVALHDNIDEWFGRIRQRYIAGGTTLTVHDEQVLTDIIATKTGKSPEQACILAHEVADTYAHLHLGSALGQTSEGQAASERGKSVASQVPCCAWIAWALLISGLFVGGAAGEFGGRRQRAARHIRRG